MLFNKFSKSASKSPQQHPVAAVPVAAVNKHLPANAKKLVPSVVASGMHILGNIISDGIIDFDGVIDGNIKCQSLTVRAGGVVRGEVVAETVIVYGKVKGTIKAKTVQLLASSEVEGIVMHEVLSMEDGAFLDGKCKRTDKVYLNDNQEDDEPDGFDEAEAEPVKVLENLRLIG